VVRAQTRAGESHPPWLRECPERAVEISRGSSEANTPGDPPPNRPLHPERGARTRALSYRFGWMIDQHRPTMTATQSRGRFPAHPTAERDETVHPMDVVSAQTGPPNRNSPSIRGCPGGAVDISRGSSEANTPGIAPPTHRCTPRGVPERAICRIDAGR
jgi:hypothetical protein